MAAVVLDVVLSGAARSCSPARTSTTHHDKIDGWDAGIENRAGGAEARPAAGDPYSMFWPKSKHSSRENSILID